MAKHTLTERKVRGAQPPDGTTETTLYDGDGLVLRVRLGAAGRRLRAWQFWYARDGRRQRIGLGAWPEVSMAEARDKAQRYRELLRAGITPTAALPATEAGQPLVPRTVGELAARWAADYLTQQHKDGGAAIMAAYRRHVAPALDRTRLVDVRKLHVLHVVQPLARAGRGRTAVGVLALLRQMFTWAIRNDYAAVDPTAGLAKADFGPGAAPRERHLSPDEIVELARRLPAQRRAGPAGRERDVPVLPLPHQAAVWVMLATMARVGELSRARWEHIDWRAGTWLIPAEHAKNAQAHVVHLSAFAVRHLRHLQQHAAGAAYVLPARTGKTHLDVKALTKSLGDRQQRDPARPRRGRSSQRAALLLPGGPFTAHDLRRTGATLMQAAGVDTAIIERCLNHVEPNRMVRTYQRADMMPERRAAFARLGARLDELVPAAATAHLAVKGSAAR